MESGEWKRGTDQVHQSLLGLTFPNRECKSLGSSSNYHITIHPLFAYQYIRECQRKREMGGRGLTVVSFPSSPAPPKVNKVPGTIGSVLVSTKAGVDILPSASQSPRRWRRWTRKERKSGRSRVQGHTGKSESCDGVTSTRDEWRCYAQDLLWGEDHIEWTWDSNGSYTYISHRAPPPDSSVLGWGQTIEEVEHRVVPKMISTSNRV